MKITKEPASFTSVILCGIKLRTKNTATQEIAQKTAIKPPQIRIAIRAQLRRRRTLTATTSSPMAIARKKNHTIAARLRVSGGIGARPGRDPILGRRKREISKSTLKRTPREAKRMATMPAAVTAGRDSRLGSMRAVYHLRKYRGISLAVNVARIHRPL